LERKITSVFVEGDYGNNLPIIPCNITIKLISAAAENLVIGVRIRGSFILSRKLLK
jgi:hypothetical protein